MPSQNLENLVKTDKLKREPPDHAEFQGLLKSAGTRLKDARNESNSAESRFDLAYSASHALSLAALRWHGYRPDNRYIVFQCLEHTLQIPPEKWRTLAECHRRRNMAEYEGVFEADEQLVRNLIEVTEFVRQAVANLPPIINN